MKILLTLISCSGLLTAGYWGHVSYDQKRIKQIDQVIPNPPNKPQTIKSENMFEKQSRIYSM